MKCSIINTDESFPNLMDVVSYFNEGMRNYRARNFTNAIGQFENALGLPSQGQAVDHLY